MILTLNKDDIHLIKLLSNSFSNTFTSEEQIITDFNSNVFSKYYVYCENSQIVGYINFYDLYDRFEIANIEVLENFRNRKIGSKLIEKIIKLGFEKKITNITLEVRCNNTSAIELYKKYDFKKVAIRNNYYNGIDGILMERKMIFMNDMYILAIESSCDETSCSIVKNGEEDIATVILSQIDIHTNFGGVVPEIASRHHLKNITMVIEETLKKANMKMEEIDAIAVTYGPGLIGSLLVGLEAAKTLALIYNKPLIPVHHIAGHIYANNLVKKMEYPLISLVVSGGHTELIYMEDEYKFEKLGGTLDDAVGECYDKVARVIGVGYPGGPIIDKMSKQGEHEYNLPLPLNDESYNFSFSGLKSAVINLAHNSHQKGIELNKENLAKSFQDVVVEIITKKTMKALKDKNVKRLIVAGGVAANSGIREKLQELCIKENIDYSFPNLKYCTDNATMIGAAAYFAYKNGKIATINLNAKSSEKLV